MGIVSRFILRVSAMCVLCAMLMACAWVAQSSSHYADRQAAESTEAFAKSWLPEWLPASSVNIREKHDLDNGERILRFEFDAAKDEAPFGNVCAPIAAKEIGVSDLDAWWWPSIEDIQMMPRLYICSHEYSFLAVPSEGGVAYFWR